jgi:VIT1/CCC1 family predicted Fe2+/Mn2+ transporter
MPNDFTQSAKRVLEPYDRVSEVLFGLIMVLTATGSLSVAGAGRAEIRTMLIGALGCNLAWGIIDGVFYLMGCLAERSRTLLAWRAIRRSTDLAQAQRLLAGALPPLIASVAQPAELAAICQRLKELPEPPERARLGRADWWGALGVFLLVFLSTFPVVIPFLCMENALRALRLSNGIAIAMLFLAGCTFGRVTGRRPGVMGLALVVLGGLLVGITIALGG